MESDLVEISIKITRKIEVFEMKGLDLEHVI